MANSQIDNRPSLHFLCECSYRSGAAESSFENSGASEIIEEIQRSGISPFQ